MAKTSKTVAQKRKPKYKTRGHNRCRGWGGVGAPPGAADVLAPTTASLVSAGSACATPLTGATSRE
jgi:hypothetical protein